jgi:hypothetical protein
MISKFDAIRPYDDSDLPLILNKLVNNNELIDILVAFRFSSLPSFLRSFFRYLMRHYIHRQTRKIITVEAFQTLIEPYMQRTIDSTTTDFSLSGFEQLDLTQSYLFVSNHRDIALDPGFVNWALHINNQDTARIAVGDNLLDKDWVADLIRLNKCFIVRRSAKDKRQKLGDAKLLSEYIQHSLHTEKQHIWIAQREGRAKDGNDVTNPAILSMLALNRPKDVDISTYIKSLRIVPVSISYEFDPCDINKAEELHETEMNGSYDKNDCEDLNSIAAGIVGNKGRVHVHFSKVLDEDFVSTRQVADYLNKQIVAGYHCFATAFVAADMLGLPIIDTGVDFDNQSRLEAKQYLLDRTARLTPEIKNRLLNMYAAPLSNKHSGVELS